MAGEKSNDSRAPVTGRSRLIDQALILALLLVAPVIAFARLNLGSARGLVLVTLVLTSLLAFFCQWIDKRRAEKNDWRVPEAVLHLLELLGGWPGSYVAQRVFRHKTSKLIYQAVFWLIALLYEFVAVDFLLGWKITQQVRQLVGF